MNYRLRKSIVVVVLVLEALMTSAFSFGNQDVVEIKHNEHQIVPYWDNADYVNLGLSMASGRANCTLNVIGKSNTTKIVADLQLYRINTNGSYTSVASWKNITSYGNSLNVTRSASIT